MQKGYNITFTPLFLSLFCTILLSISHSRALFSQPLLNGSRNAVLSNASVALPENDWPEVNPALALSSRDISISFFTSEGYGLRELRSTAINFFIPGEQTSWGAMLYSFGYEAYRELKLVATMSRSFSFNSTRPLTLGASVTINRIRIRGIPPNNEAAFSAGFLAEIWPNLFIGASLINWYNTNPSVSLEENLRIGIGYYLTNQTWLLVGLKKSMAYPLSLSTGIELLLIPGLTLRSSMSSQPYRMAIGFDVIVKRLIAGILVERHMILKWTPALSIGLHL